MQTVASIMRWSPADGVEVAVRAPGTRDPEFVVACAAAERGALVTRIQRTYYSDNARPVETADIVVPAALCEIVYEVPVNP